MSRPTFKESSSAGRGEQNRVMMRVMGGVVEEEGWSVETGKLNTGISYSILRNPDAHVPLLCQPVMCFHLLSACLTKCQGDFKEPHPHPEAGGTCEYDGIFSCH